MALSSYMKCTEVAVNNSQGSVTVDSATRRIRFSSDVDFEIRPTNGGDGFRVAGDSRGEVFENVNNWQGEIVYVWSAGNGTIHVCEELGVLG